MILPFFNLQEINNVLHAGVVAELKSRVPATNERQAKILEFLRHDGDWFSVRVNGPLWFRGYDQWSDEEGALQVSKLLGRYKATHLVVAHTVQKGGRIRPRFGNRVFLIDTGMLSCYYYPDGRPSALEILAITNSSACIWVAFLNSAGSLPQDGGAWGARRAGEWGNIFGKIRGLTGRPYMFRNDGGTGIRQEGSEGRLYG